MATHTETRDLIEASSLNKLQKRAANYLLSLVRRNTETTLKDDVVDYRLTINHTPGEKFASFVCFADSRLYTSTLTCVIGPRGGKDIDVAELRFQDSYTKTKFHI